MTPRRRIALLLLLLLVVLGYAAWQRWGPGAHGHHHQHGPGFGKQPHAHAPVAGVLPVRLERLATGFHGPTDLQFVAGQNLWLVLEKDGDLWWLGADGSARGKYLHADVVSDSEEGLLGLALHPAFRDNGRFFLNTVVRKRQGEQATDWTQIQEWHAPGPVRDAAPRLVRVVLEVQQPFANHNAGQLQFGPDGMLYIGLGDGGGGGDPQGNGQNPQTWLGKMLRIDVDHTDPGRAYAVAADNPGRQRTGWLPEIWAMGLRNPWRYSFDERGRLVIADVGQNAWEEVDIASAGDNLGWNRREANACYPPGSTCESTGMRDPVWSYGHDVGPCVTGGYVATGARVPAIRGKFVLGDFMSGELWALDLPEPLTGTARAWRIADTDLHIASFGRDAAGDLYAADFFTGSIYALQPGDVTPAAATPR